MRAAGHEDQLDRQVTTPREPPMVEEMASSRALRTPRAAAVAGVLFALLLTTALVLVRTAVPGGPGDGSWLADPGRRRQVILALNLVPFSGIAFLWFIGVVRDRIGEREDRFFATVFLGSGLLFIAMLFVASAVAAGSLADLAARGGAAGDGSGFNRRIGALILHTYAMRMAEDQPMVRGRRDPSGSARPITRPGSRVTQ
jgi:hypothetical protein